MSDPEEVRLRAVDSLEEIPAADWDALVSPEDTPFVSHAWLRALEEAGCVVPKVGWFPRHLTLWRGGKLIGAMPAYLKANSEGEFVFDYGWANAAGRLGIRYYPRLVSAVPFTPATGSRLLVTKGEPRAPTVRLFAHSFRALVEQLELSSGHVLFPTELEAQALESAGYALRLGVQYHWYNRGYATWDDFLGSFPSKRRHQLRRERREVERAGIVTRTLRGAEITDEVLEVMYRFYLATVEAYRPWTRQYLNRRFFERVLERMPESIEVVLAREGGRPIAGAFNVSGGGRLYGRYWGAVQQRPFLHFHVCYYHSIEECIARGIQVFEPGAGGEHKRPRGFEPTLTRSAHLITDRRLDQAVRNYLELERDAVLLSTRGPRPP